MFLFSDDLFTTDGFSITVVDKSIAYELDGCIGISALHLFCPYLEEGDDVPGMTDGLLFLTDNTTVEEGNRPFLRISKGVGQSLNNKEGIWL